MSGQSTLELFLLALISRGVSTPYEFKAQAGLSIGATKPALERLLGNGLIKKGEKGSRSRMEYLLTSAGRREVNSLSSTIGNFFVTPPPDVESILRLSVLAWMAGDKRAALDLLGVGIRQRKQRFDKSGRLIDIPQAGPQLYKWALGICEGRRSASETEALEFILRALKKRSSPR